ncbi:hypothetical protein ACIBQ1_54240 [Nonomuraea sp. NPDC050153]|uniref:hypothetical protein n=1 Tax=Nonomuraea sp. NPDC050153 TaxID=3364359 RepID=UPI0037B7F61F
MGKKRRRKTRRGDVIGMALLLDELDLATMTASYPSFEFDNYDQYLAVCEQTMRSMLGAGHRVMIGTFIPAEYSEYCQAEELPPDSATSRARYALAVCEDEPFPYRGEPIAEFVASLAHRERLRTLSIRTMDLLDPLPHGEVLEAEEYTADLLAWLSTHVGPGPHRFTCHVGDGAHDPLEVVAEVELEKNSVRAMSTEIMALSLMLSFARAAKAGGSVIMRSFTFKTDPVSGSPVKIVRGWAIVEGVLRPLTATEIMKASRTDPRTGDSLPPEPAVEYVDSHEPFEQ